MRLRQAQNRTWLETGFQNAVVLDLLLSFPCLSCEIWLTLVLLLQFARLLSASVPWGIPERIFLGRHLCGVVRCQMSLTADTNVFSTETQLSCGRMSKEPLCSELNWKITTRKKQTDWAVEQRNLECWTCVLLKKTSLFSTVSLFSSFSPVYVQDKWGDRDKRSCHPQLWDYFSHCTPRDQIRPFKNQKSLCIVFECLQTKGNTKYVFFKYIRLTNKFEKKIALICPIPTISTDLCSLSLRIVNVECLQSNHLNVFGGA